MKPPRRLKSLIEEGLIDTVVRQLTSGKGGDGMRRIIDLDDARADEAARRQRLQSTH